MSFLEQIYIGDKEQAVGDIIRTYQRQGYCVLSFVYFSNVMQGRLLEPKQYEWQQEYLDALENADYVFPDGIALQLFYRRGAVGRRNGILPHNLNGTDFNPYLLQELALRSNAIHIALYDLYDEKIGKDRTYIEVAKNKFQEKFGIGISFVFQTHYAERKTAQFDFDGYEASLAVGTYDYKILWMSVGSPDKEIWVEKYREFIEKHGLLVINAGGTLDYISGFEKRAPDRVVKMRVLETFWRILQNPNKNLKKLLPMFGIFRYWWWNIQQSLKAIFSSQ